MDPTGLTQVLLQNMVSYICEFGTPSSERVDELMAELRRAVEAGEYLFLLPQFPVTGVARSPQSSNSTGQRRSAGARAAQMPGSG